MKEGLTCARQHLGLTWPSEPTNHRNYTFFLVRLYILEFCPTPLTDDFRQACEAIERKWQFRLHSNFPLMMNRDEYLSTGAPRSAPPS